MFHLPSFLRILPFRLTVFVLSFRFCSNLWSWPARLSDLTATRFVVIGFDKFSLFLFRRSEDADGAMKCGLVNSWFAHEEEAGSCFTCMSTGGEIVFVCTTFLVATNSFVTTVVPVLLETEVEVINVDGACCWSCVLSMSFWDGMFVISDADLDVGNEDSICPLLDNSVRALPEILKRINNVNVNNHHRHFWENNTLI